MTKKEEQLCNYSKVIKVKRKLECLKTLKKVYFARGTHTEINMLSDSAFDMLEEIKNDPFMILIYANNTLPCSEYDMKVISGYDIEKCFFIEFDDFSIFIMLETGVGEPLVFKDMGIVFDVIPHIE